jgi:hypothetical protein
MNINPRVLINKKTGKIYFDRFIPRPLNEIEKELVFDIDLIHLLHRASKFLLHLSAYLKDNDFSVYIPLFRKIEAYYSLHVSSIEIDPVDILSGNSKLRSPNLGFFESYLKASDFALENYQNLSFIALNEKINGLLIEDSACKSGSFRKTNFVSNIVLTPVHPKDIKCSMNKLSLYFEENSNLSFLIRAALIYYQFLAISPFQVGNHRQVKILILVYFHKQKLFYQFPLSLSRYFCRNLKIYYEALVDVRSKGDYLSWIELFLKGIENTVSQILKMLEKIIAIKYKNQKLIMESKYSKTIKKNLLQLLDYLGLNPVVEIKNICSDLSKSYPTVASSIEILQELNIIYSMNSNRRNRSYEYREHFHALFGL